jgi:hypothetical protein
VFTIFATTALHPGSKFVMTSDSWIVAVPILNYMSRNSLCWLNWFVNTMFSVSNKYFTGSTIAFTFNSSLRQKAKPYLLIYLGTDDRSSRFSWFSINSLTIRYRVRGRAKCLRYLNTTGNRINAAYPAFFFESSSFIADNRCLFSVLQGYRWLVPGGVSSWHQWYSESLSRYLNTILDIG